MTPFTIQFNHILGFATLLGHLVLVLMLVFYFLGKKNVFTKFFAEYALELTVLTLGFGTFLSLFYSEVLHVLPCVLCWYQRVFIYSGFIIGLVGLWKKDIKILDYITVLMTMCLVVGIYNYYIQWGGTPLIPCSSSSFGVSCQDKTILEFGYITIPLMSVTSSVGVLLLYAFHKKFEK